jgi:hypothetical protein
MPVCLIGELCAYAKAFLQSKYHVKATHAPLFLRVANA